MTLRVMLLDDNAHYRQALKFILEVQQPCQVVSELSDGDMVLAAIAQSKPQLIFLDIEMRHENGPDIARRVLQHHPNIKIMALSAHTDCKRVTDMLEAGARGYAVKGQPFTELLHAIQVVSEGKIYVDPSIDMHQGRGVLE